jgi:hypothetical protein
MVEAAKNRLPYKDLHLSYHAVPAGTILHRVHANQFGSVQYNPTGGGNARFSPIMAVNGRVVPTLYAGGTFQCAVLETVFHDVPHEPGYKFVQQQRLRGIHYSQIRTETELRLVDLSSKALRLLGVKRNELIDTDADCYPYTRQWAAAIHAQAGEAQGLRWVSRQDDEAMAVMLFGDRIEQSHLTVHHAGRDILDDSNVFDQLLDLAERIGVCLVR